MRPRLLVPLSVLAALMTGLAVGPGAVRAMKTPSPTAAKESPSSGASAAQRVSGDWHGTLRAGGVELRILVRFAPRPGGGLGGTLDSPDQGVAGLVVDTVLVRGDTLHFELRASRAAYRGIFTVGGDSVHGQWLQGSSLPLDLVRGSPPERRRAQDPVKPRPYEEESVTVQNPAVDVRLAGTFTKPRGSGPFPAALLITGSGPQNRDEELMGHRPFLVLADHLTRHGLAVLRLDDRGVGGSTGSFALATTADFASDARAAVEYLKTRPDVDRTRIGLIGHSEGALAASMVAAGAPDIFFVVLLAGPGVTGDSLLYLQGEALMAVMGEGAEMIAWNRRLQGLMFAEVKTAPDSAALRQRLGKVIAAALPLLPESRRSQINARNLAGQVDVMSTRWFRAFVACDPAPALRRIACPVLAVTGGKDLQVPPKANLPAIERALAAGGNRDFRAVELPGLNHLFQGGGTGSPAEYGTLEETFAPAALDTITTWIEARVKKPPEQR